MPCSWISYECFWFIAAEILEADSEPSGKAAKTLSLLDVLLDGVGPNRERVLEFTPAPTRPGRLNELPEMVKTRTRLVNLVCKSLKGTNLTASELNISLPHADKIALGSVLDSIYNFTASQMTPSLNVFSREHTPDQLPPSKQIILHEFMRDLTLVQIYQEFMNGTPNVPFIIMSSFLKSSIKVVQNIFLPYNVRSADLPEQLMEQENSLRLVHEILGTLGDGDDAEKSRGHDTNGSVSEALANLRSRFCPAFEANVTGTVCGNISVDDSNNGAIDLDAKPQCSISKVVCTILKELWQ